MKQKHEQPLTITTTATTTTTTTPKQGETHHDLQQQHQRQEEPEQHELKQKQKKNQNKNKNKNNNSTQHPYQQSTTWTNKSSNPRTTTTTSTQQKHNSQGLVSRAWQIIDIWFLVLDSWYWCLAVIYLLYGTSRICKSSPGELFQPMYWAQWLLFGPSLFSSNMAVVPVMYARLIWANRGQTVIRSYFHEYSTNDHYNWS